MDLLQNLSRQDSAVSITPPGPNDQNAQAMLEFLVWLEQAKGLTLCRAFKPQYDWYMPALSNKEKLAREFLGNNRSAGFENTSKESFRSI
jgi:hypothetical protein